MSFFYKINRIKYILSSNGNLGLCRHLFRYVRSNVKDKFEYTYFELSLENPPYSLPSLDESFLIRIAQPHDIPKIQSNIYPFLTVSEEYDKWYLARIGEEGFSCFIVEKDDKIVNYTLVFHNAHDSPLTKTPIYKTKVFNSDAYLSTVFTVPDARGAWIVPHALLFELKFLKEKIKASRVLLLVHKETKGAKEFYLRLGFRIMENVSPSSFLESIFKKNLS